MLLSVDHVTRYMYDTPVRGVVQSHRLQPSVHDGQKVVHWSVIVTGGKTGGQFRDGAGDLIQAWSVQGPVSEIVVTVQGTVETTDLSGLLRGHRETTPPDCYMVHTMPTRADVALTELARSVADVTDALDRAHRLSAAISDAIVYAPGETDAQTTAAEALALGKGVCQDHTHAMISVARCAGLPARYVSGYLHATQGADADSPAQEAAHAWAEVWIAGLGWIGFDAANRCCPDERYIRLGSGLDSVDAAPIRGISRGPGTETLDVTVAVLSSQQQAQ